MCESGAVGEDELTTEMTFHTPNSSPNTLLLRNPSMDHQLGEGTGSIDQDFL